MWWISYFIIKTNNISKKLIKKEIIDRDTDDKVSSRQSIDELILLIVFNKII